MFLEDLLYALTLDTVVNIVNNGEIIESFKVIDYFFVKKCRLKKYNCPVITVDFNDKKNVTVQMKKEPLGVKKELTCFKDGSYMLDEKPFSNIGELLEYLIKCNY